MSEFPIFYIAYDDNRKDSKLIGVFEDLNGAFEAIYLDYREYFHKHLGAEEIEELMIDGFDIENVEIYTTDMNKPKYNKTKFNITKEDWVKYVLRRGNIKRGKVLSNILDNEV